MNKKRRGSGLSFYVILMLVILASSFFFNRFGPSQNKDLSDLEQMIQEKKIDSIVINGSKLELDIKDEKGNIKEQYTKQIHQLMVPDYVKLAQEAKQKGLIQSFDYRQPVDIGSFFNILILGLMVLGMGFFIWFTYSQRGGSDGRNALNFGRSKAKLNNPDQNEVTFADVAGAEEEKEELQEVVGFLKNPDKFSALGAKIPKGILLVGPPGTGKTLLAKAVAGEAGVPFFSISGSDFVEMFVGVGASRVRDMFSEAKKKAPCIVFIDEIDAVGRHRGAGLGGGHDEREQTLNQLLVEMDGFGPNEGVIVMAATNRQDILDPALLRPGRFDRRIMVQRPDLLGRRDILQVHAKNKILADNIDLKEIAKITPGFTGADLANLLNEAALLAARRNAKEISYSDISEAVFKITIGPEKKSRVISEKERRITAYHEAGHAIVLRSISNSNRVERVSIIPAGSAGGYTAHKPNEDTYFHSKGDLIETIMHALGGRAAEELTQDDITTGAYSDLQQCNQIAREMITKYGMSEKLGNFVLADDDEVFLGRDYGHAKQYSEAISSLIDEEVAAILDQCYQDTLRILREESVLLEQLAQRLLEKEKVEGPEFEALYKEYAVNYRPAPGDDSVKFISDLEKDDQAESEEDLSPSASPSQENLPSDGSIEDQQTE